MIIILSFLTKILGSIVIIFQILIVFFNLLIFIVSMRENEKDFLSSDKNIKDEINVLHWRVVYRVLNWIKKESKGEHTFFDFAKLFTILHRGIEVFINN